MDIFEGLSTAAYGVSQTPAVTIEVAKIRGSLNQTSLCNFYSTKYRLEYKPRMLEIQLINLSFSLKLQWHEHDKVYHINFWHLKIKIARRYVSVKAVKDLTVLTGGTSVALIW